MKCSQCGHLALEGERFCAICGAKIEEPEMEKTHPGFCSRCGQKLLPEDQNCPHCGEKIKKIEAAADSKESPEPAYNTSRKELNCETEQERVKFFETGCFHIRGILHTSERMRTEIILRGEKISVTTHWLGWITKCKPTTVIFEKGEIDNVAFGKMPIWYVSTIVMFGLAILITAISLGSFLPFLFCMWWSPFGGGDIGVRKKALIISMKNGLTVPVFIDYNSEVNDFLQELDLHPSGAQFEEVPPRLTFGRRFKKIVLSEGILFLSFFISCAICCMVFVLVREFPMDSYNNDVTVEASAAVAADETTMAAVTDTTEASENVGTYILPFDNERLVTNEDLAPLTASQLRLARNELYARHGRIYKTKDLNDYFSAQSWYYPSVTEDQWSDRLFSPIEEQNVLRIQGYEKYGNVEYSEHPEDPYYYGNSENEETDDYDYDTPEDIWEAPQDYAPVQTQPRYAAPAAPNYEKASDGSYAKYSFKAGGSFDGRTQLSNGNYLYSSINVMIGDTDIECPVSANAMYGTVIASGVYYDMTRNHYFASNVSYDPSNGGTLYFSN